MWRAAWAFEYIDRTGYSRSPNGTDLQDTLDAQPCLLPIKRSDVQPGDLLLMRFKAALQHVAIYAARPSSTPTSSPVCAVSRASVRRGRGAWLAPIDLWRPADEQRRADTRGIGGAIIGGLLAARPGRSTARRLALPLAASSIRQKPNQTGPRLDDLSMQGASYGSAIPRVYGTIAMAGTVVWLENNELKEVSKKTTQGGKGGPSTTTTTYSYYATFALAICQGPITGVRRIWAGQSDL